MFNKSKDIWGSSNQSSNQMNSNINAGSTVKNIFGNQQPQQSSSFGLFDNNAQMNDKSTGKNIFISSNFQSTNLASQNNLFANLIPPKSSNTSNIIEAKKEPLSFDMDFNMMSDDSTTTTNQNQNQNLMSNQNIQENKNISIDKNSIHTQSQFEDYVRNKYDIINI